jgi:hypothetical protein
MRKLLALLLLLVGCAGDQAARKIEAACGRWANKYAAYGFHANPSAYREDLISTCMAIKGSDYQPRAVTSYAKPPAHTPTPGPAAPAPGSSSE